MDSGGVYGSGGATGEFQLQAFVSKPQVILRLIGWLFAIVVFGCIADKGHQGNDCVYNGVEGACGYGIAVGVIAFLALMAFLVLDAMFDNISNVMHRKYAVLADIGFSGFWTFMWFVCFCLLADLWRRTEHSHINSSAPGAAVAFSFFSIAIFAALTVFAVRRYRLGVGSDFQSGYDPDIFGDGDRHGAPYTGPSDAYQGSDYRQSPFADPANLGAEKPAPPPAAASAGYQQQQSY
jgi:hypothetical protein